MEKVVLFDIGDTLLELWGVRFDHRFQIIASLAGLHLPHTPETLHTLAQDLKRWHDQAFTRTDIGKPTWWTEYYACGLRSLGVAEPGTLAEKMNHIARSARYFHRPIPGAEQLLTALRAHGYLIAAVSNWSVRLPEDLAETGLARYFDLIVASASIGIKKPDPSILHHALEQLEVLPGQAVMVGDMPSSDLTAARAAGIKAVLYDPTDSFSNHPEPRVHQLVGLIDHLLPKES